MAGTVHLLLEVLYREARSIDGVDDLLEVLVGGIQYGEQTGHASLAADGGTERCLLYAVRSGFSRFFLCLQRCLELFELRGLRVLHRRQPVLLGLLQRFELCFLRAFKCLQLIAVRLTDRFELIRMSLLHGRQRGALGFLQIGQLILMGFLDGFKPLVIGLFKRLELVILGLLQRRKRLVLAGLQRLLFGLLPGLHLR